MAFPGLYLLDTLLFENVKYYVPYTTRSCSETDLLPFTEIENC